MNEDEQLGDLKKIFGTRQILSPREVGELVGLSVKTLANQRCSNTSLIPSKKFGKNVGFHVKDVARFLVTGSCETSVQQTQRLSVAKSSRGGLTKNRDWLLAKNLTIDLNLEMMAVALEFWEQKMLKDKVSKELNGIPSKPRKPNIPM